MPRLAIASAAADPCSKLPPHAQVGPYFVGRSVQGPVERIRLRLPGRSFTRRLDLTKVPVSTRSAKGLTVTKWLVKDVKRTDLALK